MATSPPPEARLIEEARVQRGLSQNRAADLAGITGTRWRQIVNGTRPASGPRVTQTVASMGLAVDVTREAMAAAGRSDVADVMAQLHRERSEGGADPLTASSPDPLPPGHGRLEGEPHLRPGEVLTWSPMPGNTEGIDYRLRWDDPVSGQSAEVSGSLSRERTIQYVIEHFREQINKYRTWSNISEKPE